MNRLVLALSLCAGSTLSAHGGLVPPVSPQPESGDAYRVIGTPFLDAADRFEATGYPNFDVRIGGEKGFALPWVVSARESSLSKQQREMRDVAIARLKSGVPDVTIDFDQYTGTVSSVRSLTQMLTGRVPTEIKPEPLQAARDFVGEFADVFSIGPSDLDDARLSRNYLTDHNGAQHLTFQQQHRGVDILGAQVIANVDRFGSIINIGSTFIPSLDHGSIAEPVITAREALRLAAATVGVSIEPPAEGRLINDDPETLLADQATVWEGIPQLRHDDAIVTRLVYFPRTVSDVRPAWTVVVPVPGIGHTYDIVIDAVNGEMLSRQNRLVSDTTQPITMRIFPTDSPAPGSPGLAAVGTTQFPSIQRTLLTVTPDQMRPYSPNGWIDDNAHTTVGNNVDAHTDRSGNNTADPRPDGGVARVFDFPYNETQDPAQWSNFAVVQMFWFANNYHDRLYSLGFNEAASNYQTLNFGRGGAAGDAVIADGQDGSGTNNANWNGTGNDGTSGRMQMFIFNGCTPARDGTVDGDIVYHELTHGLSIRLHGGITDNVTRGMGEGWSDFYGICLNAEAGDDPQANYTVGPYATKQFLQATFLSNYYFAIRRFPYSTNLNINPQTFADTDDGQQSYPTNVPRSPIIDNTASEVHNMGEVWCNTLMECRAALWTQFGFPGNARMMQLTTDGMKLHAAGNPSFLQSRDTIIQADNVDYAGVDRPALWTAFAKRGMGSAAAAPGGSTSSAGVVESYAVPFDAIFTYPGGQPEQLQPGAVTSFNVNITEFGLTLVPNSGWLHLSVNDGAWTTVNMTEVTPGRYRADIPAYSCFDKVKYYTSINTSLGRRSNPLGAPTGATVAIVYTDTAIPFADNGETDMGWTVNTTATDGAWDRGVPLYSGSVNSNLDRGDPATDFDHVGTGKCWLTKNNLSLTNTNTDVDAGSTTLTSRAFAVQNGDAISFAAWSSTNLNGAFSVGDGLFVEYSLNNGTNWTPLVSYTTPSPTWRTAKFIVGSNLPASNTMKFRFIATDTTQISNVVECGMDAFKVTHLLCTQPGPCPADFNQDGGVDGGDVQAFFLAWQAGDPSSDVNQDGGVDGSDVQTFFIAWQNGGC
jgi:hypothetical protein